MSAVASLDEFLEKVAQRDGHQPELIEEVLPGDAVKVSIEEQEDGSRIVKF